MESRGGGLPAAALAVAEKKYKSAKAVMEAGADVKGLSGGTR